MKLLLVVIGLICVSVGVNSLYVGARECTWGPSYWCKNITNAKSCGAVKHCIQTDWEHRKVPVDDDSICKICLDMVKQARDQLESNETQEELKEVFEGSCKLIPIKTVSKECCKLADDFVPELVETLASQMNPNVVCTVAGLCNNEWIDKELERVEGKKPAAVIPATPLIEATDTMDDCEGCKVVINHMENLLHSTSRDAILSRMLHACGRLGSLSDSCSAIIITYFNEIHSFLQQNMKADGMCHIAGVCSARFHVHRPQPVKKIEVVHESNVGVVKPKDNVPCDLCKQLVVHLRDILVANTTEDEFEQVMKGLCQQTGSFKSECLSLVTEYYAVIYDFLVNNLQPEEICKLAGLCTPGAAIQGPIWPLLPVSTVEAAREKGTLLTSAQPVDKVAATPLSPAQPTGQMKAAALTPAKLHRVAIGDNGGSVKVLGAENVQLPIERMLPQTVVYVNNKEVCEFCEYFLHYVQQAITSPQTEEEIEKIVSEACDKLPQTIEGQCKEFVDTYGNAFIALLAQRIDPSQVCPMLGLCPGKNSGIHLDMTHTVQDKPTCPLCLLAVQSLVNKLKDHRTEEEIKKELDTLCADLPQSLVAECRDFVTTYTDELVDMLIADFTPEEICTYLKLCDPTKKKVETTTLPDILTNEIPDYPVKSVGQKKLKKDTPYCVICEFVMSKLDQELKDTATEEEIKEAVHSVCNHLPTTVANECNHLVDEYADLVIALLAQGVSPQEVCSALHLCNNAVIKHPMLVSSVKKSVKECAVCEAAMGALDELMGDPNLQRDVEQLLKKVCPMLPVADQQECRKMIDIYGPSILNVVSTVADPRLVCMEIGLCNWHRQTVHLLGGKNCAWGPKYWCQSVAHSKSCDSLEYCQQNVWKAKAPANN